MVSVNIASASSSQPSFIDRLLGRSDTTVIRESSTTTITNEPAARFSIKDALTFGGIGAGVAGVLGGVSLLGKVALPLIGKVASIGGLARIAGIGGLVGVGIAALPLVAPAVRDNPAMKAALTGAGIGAAASFILPGGPVFGAVVGAGVGLAVHLLRRDDSHGYTVYPGYSAHPGFSPVGTSPGDAVPAGLVPVSPSWGGYGAGGYQMQQQPSLLSRLFGLGSSQMQYPAYGASMVQGSYPSYGATGVGYSPYGQTLGMTPTTTSAAQLQAQQQAQMQAQAQPGPAPAAAAPVSRPVANATAKPKRAKVWKTSLQQQAAQAARDARAKNVAAARGAAEQAAMAQQQAAAAQPQGLAAYLPQGTFAGGTPFTAGQAGLQQLMAQAPNAMNLTGAAGAAPQLTGLSAATAGAALPPMPTA